MEATAFEQLFSEHRRFLRGLCYRLTGSVADAEDLVQDTFVRAMERPPARTDQPGRPWLVKIALNLGRDLLRRRKRRGYVGPWLPSPIDTAAEESPFSFEPEIAGQSTEARYELLESVSFAFLLALEALTPSQRAVLLLRDVFDYSVAQTAEALEMTEGAVKTTHHRARAAMAQYDRDRCVPSRELQEQTREVLRQFVDALVRQDVRAVESWLSSEVRALSDGGGKFYAARKPIAGRERVARFFSNISARRPPRLHVDFRILNGLPAVVVDLDSEDPDQPPRIALCCRLDRQDRIAELYTVLAPDKLLGLRSR